MLRGDCALVLKLQHHMNAYMLYVLLVPPSPILGEVLHKLHGCLNDIYFVQAVAN